MTLSDSSIPRGLCWCGCGRKTNIAKMSSRRLNVKVGEPYRFVQGHGQVQRPDPPLTPPPDGTRYVSLSKGQSAIVDAIEYEGLSQSNWYATWNEHTKSFYAGRKTSKEEIVPNVEMAMHRQILGLKYGDPRQGDHINGNTLDNRRENLRIATYSQNAINTGITRKNKSGYKGIAWRKDKQRWRARISVDGQEIFLGHFTALEDAISVYRSAQIKYHGEFSRD